MAMPPVTDEIDHEVALEAGSVRERELHGLDTGSGFIRIDMNDGNLKALGQITGVEGTAR
jgi:hypothetical protein